jgi:hypothetical protein
MTTRDTAPGAAEAERQPLLGWRTLFFGCFGRDAGSRAWSWRGAWGAIFPALGFAARYGLEGVLPEAATDAILAVSFGLAIGFIYWTTWKYMLDLDEMHQRIMLEGFMFSFCITMPLVVGLGIYGLAARWTIDILWVYVAAEILRGVGLVVAGRKYR